MAGCCGGFVFPLDVRLHSGTSGWAGGGDSAFVCGRRPSGGVNRVSRGARRVRVVANQDKRGENEPQKDLTPTEKLTQTFRSFLLGRLTTRNQDDAFEVDLPRSFFGGEQQETEELNEAARRRNEKVAAAPSDEWADENARFFDSATAISEDRLSWEERYKSIFLQDEGPSLVNTNRQEFKDEIEKVSLGVLAIVVLVIVLKAFFAFIQFMFNFTFSFIAIFLLSAGIFVLFFLSKF
mmetsp:Transcript_6011/g.25452  ORF Transcript_6011/g.25452 Transcript_6011/m.25452 type:complete len:237 (-) Transcript_6011:3487-4197(-)